MIAGCERTAMSAVGRESAPCVNADGYYTRGGDEQRANDAETETAQLD